MPMPIVCGQAVAEEIPANDSADTYATISGVQLSYQDAGVSLQIVVSDSSMPQIFKTADGSSLLVEIENARLSEESLAGYYEITELDTIDSIEIAQAANNLVTISIVGTGSIPDVMFARGDGMLDMSVSVTADETVASQDGTEPETPSDGQPSPAPTDPAPLPDDDFELVVQAVYEDENSYLEDTSSIATRTETPIKDTPVSIQVIPKAVLKDQNTRSLSEALSNVSGTSAGRTSTESQATTPIIRGFESRNILRNGLRDETFNLGGAVNNIESIEVLKGPSSVLFGAGDLGGTISVQTEKPLKESRYELNFEYGSFNQINPSIDFTGPLNKSGQLAYRLNVSYEDKDTFRDFESNETLFVAPSLQVIDTEKTQLLFEAEYFRTRNTGSPPGLPALAAIGFDNNEFVRTQLGSRINLSPEEVQRAGTLDISTNVGEPLISRTRTEIFRAGYTFKHQLSDRWKLRNEFLAAIQNTPVSTFVVGTNFPPTSSNLGAVDGLLRTFGLNPSRRESFIMNTSVDGEFKVLGIDQKLLLGTEISYNRELDEFGIVLPTGIEGAETFNVFEPNFQPETFLVSGIAPRTDTVANRFRVGFYGQSQLNFSKQFIGVIGGRFDIADQRFVDQVARFGETDANRISTFNTNFSPRAGIVYKPIESLSLFAGYSRSFNPVVGSDIDRNAFVPETGEQIEAGIKKSFFNERLFMTVSYYNLKRNNVATQDPQNLGSQIQVGQQKSEGVEFDLAGEILPGWNIITNYAFNNARIAEDNQFEQGTQLVNIPKNSARIWTSYRFGSGLLEGFGLGMGLTYVDRRNGDFFQPFELPAFLRTDAAVFYAFDNLRFQINADNLFNVRYFSGSRGQFRVIPGASRTVSGNVQVTF
ncbi:MAG: TonB-dependent siderophore receptor [Cyanobacteria bacterium P01_F01_bin.42]